MRRLALLAFPVVPLCAAACASGATDPQDHLIDAPHRLVLINNTAVPYRYYDSPDGLFYVVADSGCITFYSDGTVRWATHRLIFFRGWTEPDTQVAIERVQYRRDSTLLWIARAPTRWDSARVYGDDIHLWPTHEGIALGRWIYHRETTEPGARSICAHQ